MQTIRCILATYFFPFLSGCLPVDLAHIAYKELKDSLQMVVLSTDLHLLYLATPVALSSSIQPNWMVYFQEVNNLYWYRISLGLAI